MKGWAQEGEVVQECQRREVRMLVSAPSHKEGLSEWAVVGSGESHFFPGWNHVPFSLLNRNQI